MRNKKVMWYWKKRILDFLDFLMHPRFAHHGFTQLSVFRLQHRKHINTTDQHQKNNTHLDCAGNICFVGKHNTQILRNKKVTFLGKKKYYGFSRFHHPRFVHQKYNGFLIQISVFYLQYRKHIDTADQHQKHNTHLNCAGHI